MTVPAPPASMTYRAGLEPQHRQGQELLPNKASELPVPETCGNMGRMGQKMLSGNSLLQRQGLLYWIGLLAGDICCMLKSSVQGTTDRLSKLVQLVSWTDYYSTVLLHVGTSNMSRRLGAHKEWPENEDEGFGAWWFLLILTWGGMDGSWSSKTGYTFGVGNRV